VALAPGLFAAHNALGRALVELGEVERGVTELEAAARLAPDSPEMHYSLVRAYTRAGRADDAARERAIFTELDRKRRAQRGEPGVEGPPDKERPR
jgi:Flp pilus assembly protein TadD